MATGINIYSWVHCRTGIFRTRYFFVFFRKWSFWAALFSRFSFSLQFVISNNSFSRRNYFRDFYLNREKRENKMCAKNTRSTVYILGSLCKCSHHQRYLPTSGATISETWEKCFFEQFWGGLFRKHLRNCHQLT